MKLWRKKSKKTNHRRKLIAKHFPKSPVSEQYRTLRTNIQFSYLDGDLKTIVVTSSGPGEGKSTTSANLAVVFAQQGKKVLLVDADMRKPTVHHTFSLLNTRGLSSVILKQTTLEEAVENGVEENLYVLPSGPIPPNPAEMLDSKAMDEFLAEAEENYDLIIFDSPPIHAVTDAQILANKCDASILVVSSEETERDMAVKSKELLASSKGKFLGVVLNKRRQTQSSYYYYYDAYGTKS